MAMATIPAPSRWVQQEMGSLKPGMAMMRGSTGAFVGARGGWVKRNDCALVSAGPAVPLFSADDAAEGSG
jgi:hypothetical protein